MSLLAVKLLVTPAVVLAASLAGRRWGAALGGFAHRAQRPRAGVAALRGMASALFAFAGFFLILGLALPHADAVAAFALATVVALIVQAATLKLARAA